MAYQKTEWIAYETLVSADLLNKIENQLHTVTSNVEMSEMEIKSTSSEVKGLNSKVDSANDSIRDLGLKIESVSEDINNAISSNQEIKRLQNANTSQDREIAYLKLKQEAADRIEGGTTFATDFSDNEFGITFDELASENVVIRNGGLTMNKGATVEHVVDDSVVVEGIYDTSGNGGRKLVRLDNGTLVCAVKRSASYHLYKSIDDGNSWTQLYTLGGMSSIQDLCICTDGKNIILLVLANNSSISTKVFDENGDQLYTAFLSLSVTSLDTCSLAINEEGTELHACWASKNSTYPNSYNIQYCKGVIGEGGTVTWGSVEQVSKNNNSTYSMTQPSIAINADNRPVIVFNSYESSSRLISSYYYNGSSWKYTLVYNGSSYLQQNPSTIFVPKSINGLENGRIWVAWQGTDSTDTSLSNIRVSYSDDGGQTWSAMEKLTSGNSYTQVYPTITANKNNEVFVIWQGYTSNARYVARQIKWSNEVWGEIEDVKQSDNASITLISSLNDIKWDIDFAKPLCVYTTQNTSINFTGSWITGGYTPTTTATAVYNLPSTDYVGLFVQKEGNVNITATINDIPMDSEINGNEYQFTKALTTESDVTLKLSLNRENTTNGDGDKITRILGGIS